MIRLDVFGWFQDCGDTPAHDPGIVNGICPVCGAAIGGPGLSRAVSLMHQGGTRSYFFRAHRACWDALDADLLRGQSAELNGAELARLAVNGCGGR